MFEGLPERPPEARTPADWRAIGRALATLHAVPGPEFGLGTDGYFGPIPQDNAPVRPDSWPSFYTQRRLSPSLRLAADSGHLPGDLAAGVAQIIFHPVPQPVFDGYAELRPIDDGFGERRELCRMFAYLLVLSATGGTPLGRRFLTRLEQAVTRYR